MAKQVHVDAVARAISVPDWGAWSDTAHPDHNRWTWDGDGRGDGEREFLRDHARAVLGSDDPRVHEAMLAALVEHGVLRVDDQFIPVTQAGERWGARSRKQAVEAMHDWPVGGRWNTGKEWDGIERIDHETRVASEWRAVEP